MNANFDQRPTANEIENILEFLHHSTGDCCDYYAQIKKFGYKGKEIKAMFNEADKEISNISTSYEKNPDAIYTSRMFTFKNLSKPINSSIITSYLNEENNKGIVYYYYYYYDTIMIIDVWLSNAIITNFLLL